MSSASRGCWRTYLGIGQCGDERSQSAVGGQVLGESVDRAQGLDGLVQARGIRVEERRQDNEGRRRENDQATPRSAADHEKRAEPGTDRPADRLHQPSQRG